MDLGSCQWVRPRSTLLCLGSNRGALLWSWRDFCMGTRTSPFLMMPTTPPPAVLGVKSLLPVYLSRIFPCQFCQKTTSQSCCGGHFLWGGVDYLMGTESCGLGRNFRSSQILLISFIYSHPLQTSVRFVSEQACILSGPIALQGVLPGRSSAAGVWKLLVRGVACATAENSHVQASWDALMLSSS